MLEKIIFINSHPIQYIAPLYAQATREGLPVEVWYCSDESIRGVKDVQFGRPVKWDIPLLEGYTYRFFKNVSWKPSINNGFFGLINIQLLKAIRKAPPSLFVIHGWNYASHIFAILAAKFYRHKVAFRGETPLKQELLKSKAKLKLRRIILGRLLFKWVDYFLFIGKRNKAFYQYYQVQNEQLHSTPYAVDNDRFKEAYLNLRNRKAELKDSLHVAPNHKVILYTGKYIPVKRPLDLLKAFSKLGQRNVSLIMVGEGELRGKMERFIRENNVVNIRLTGFINQTEIVNYYAIADTFVICSQSETWGLSVNEAMNFHLPVVVSDTTGCSDDLIDTGRNGYVFSSGNVDELAEKLQLILDMPDEERKTMGDHSARLVMDYDYKVIIENLRSLIR